MSDTTANMSDVNPEEEDVIPEEEHVLSVPAPPKTQSLEGVSDVCYALRHLDEEFIVIGSFALAMYESTLGAMTWTPNDCDIFCVNSMSLDDWHKAIEIWRAKAAAAGWLFEKVNGKEGGKIVILNLRIVGAAPNVPVLSFIYRKDVHSWQDIRASFDLDVCEIAMNVSDNAGRLFMNFYARPVVDQHIQEKRMVCRRRFTVAYDKRRVDKYRQRGYAWGFQYTDEANADPFDYGVEEDEDGVWSVKINGIEFPVTWGKHVVTDIGVHGSPAHPVSAGEYESMQAIIAGLLNLGMCEENKVKLVRVLLQLSADLERVRQTPTPFFRPVRISNLF